MAWARGTAGQGCLLLLALGGVLQRADTLQVLMRVEPLIVSLNDNISIPCNILDYDTPELDINNVGVTWYLKTLGADQEQKVFTFHAGDHIPHRNGASMSDSDLKRGNAALSVPQIQFKEAGVYKCHVTVTPSDAYGTSMLEVVAQPTVSLSPKEVTVESHKGRTLSCEVNKFYPNLVDIKWMKISKNDQSSTVAAEDICTEASVENEDGTFNVTSKLRLQPSLQDNDNVYRCIVSHKTFPAKLLLNTTLTVTALKSDSSVLIGAVIGTIIACIIVLSLGVFVYNKHFKKISPTVIAFIGNVEMKHLEEASLHCQISGFRPKPLTVVFFLRKYQQQKEKIFSWNSENDINQDEESTALLTKPKNFQFKIHLKSLDNNTFEVPCTIFVSPDVHELDKAELSLEISHETFQTHPLVQATHLKVTAMPVLDLVLCSTDMPKPDEPLTLSCRIHSFFPETIEVGWYKDDDCVPEEKAFISDVTSGPDGLFFCISRLTLHFTVEDLGRRFRCRANLKGSRQHKESSWKLENLTLSPKLSKIVCEPSIPESGKAVTLSCQVRDYYPAQCQVRWIRSFEELSVDAIETQDSQLDTATNLYHRKSQVTFKPGPEDHAVEFTIEVTHCNRTIREFHPLMLKGFPKVTGIVFNPNDAEYGKPLSLSCKIMDFCPKDIQVQWFKEDVQIKEGSSVEEPKQDTNGFFYTSSDLQLKPSALDYDKKIGLKVMHETLMKCITKSVYLNLPAKPPAVSEIRPKPKLPKVNETVCLEISLSDFAPKDIKVAWYREWMELPKDNFNNNVQTGENGLCFSTIKTQFTATKSDNGKMFRCEVIHPTTNSYTEKSFILKLNDFSTGTGDTTLQQNNSSVGFRPISQEVNTLEIECITINPKAGEDVTLCCSTHGRTPNSAYVSWFKGKYPIEERPDNKELCENKPGVISFVTFKPEDQDKVCKIRCEVSTDDDVFEDTYILKLV